MGPWELSSVVGSSLAGGGRVILFAPSAALDARFGTAAVLAPDLALFAPGASSDVPSVPGSGPGAPESHCFAGREVLVVADGPAARSTAGDMAAGPSVGATAACRRERRRGRRLVACLGPRRRWLARRGRRGAPAGGPAGGVAYRLRPVWPARCAGLAAERCHGRRARRMCPCRDRLATVLSGRAARPSSRGCPAAIPRLRARGDSVERFGSLGMARRSDGDRGLPPPLVDRRPRARRRRSNHAAIPRACCCRRRGRDEAQAPQRRPHDRTGGAGGGPPHAGGAGPGSLRASRLPARVE